jgi:hypothetical protein
MSPRLLKDQQASAGGLQPIGPRMAGRGYEGAVRGSTATAYSQQPRTDEQKEGAPGDLWSRGQGVGTVVSGDCGAGSDVWWAFVTHWLGTRLADACLGGVLACRP